MTNSNDSTQPQNGSNPIDDWEMDDWQSAGWPGEIPEPSGDSFPPLSPGNTDTFNASEAEEARPELTGRITDIQPGNPAISGEATSSYSGISSQTDPGFPTGQTAPEEHSSPYSFGTNESSPSQTTSSFSNGFGTQQTADTADFPYSPSSQESFLPPEQPAWEPSPMPAKRKEKTKRGPGWLATIAIALAAALCVWLLPSDWGSRTTSLGKSPVKVATEAPVVQASAKNTNWETVAKTVQPSVVAIQVASGNSGETGSGVVFDEAGHVITNYHVVASAISGNAKVQIELFNGKIYDAKVLGSDASTDLAVLEFVSPPKDLQMAALGSSTGLRVAQPVAAIGSPLGLENTVTTGIISALDRPVVVTQSAEGSGVQIPGLNDRSGAGQQVVTNAIQVDAAINPGNSGGPLFDASGKVIGITSSIASLGSTNGGQAGSIGIGFAIPVNLVRNVADQIITSGKVTHAMLGVTIDTAVAKIGGESRMGARVSTVVRGSGADRAGLKEGDLITKIDDFQVGSGVALTGYVRWYNPGDKVKLTVLRQDGTHEIEAELGAQTSDRKYRR
ncbi:MAG: trypsin-like peptidase domain-containing protein [Varibaculum cambriense]|uniref:S1C family serine protease n=1 Tax=Varibaculum cambriense TaxID=184870 RepID=UPI002910865E|nr:trypsin-like peptidase domain-containing protein [Varibaculum cambriense]MDU4944272.1 trypsin-like peptidase domain-containing protein [Varibaculum cambriense]